MLLSDDALEMVGGGLGSLRQVAFMAAAGALPGTSSGLVGAAVGGLPGLWQACSSVDILLLHLVPRRDVKRLHDLDRSRLGVSHYARNSATARP
jgi:hypothetical protein